MQPDPMLRLLARYVMMCLGVALVVPTLVRLLALPSWVVPLVLATLVLGMPVAAAAMWLRERRR